MATVSVENIYSGNTAVVNGPDRLVFHPTDSNILFVSNNLNSKISQINPNDVNNGIALTLTPSNLLSGPRGITIDPSGNLYVANEGGNNIIKLVPTGGITYSSTTLDLTSGPNSLSGPYGITFDSSGNLFVTNRSGNNISKLVPTGDLTYSCTTLNLTSGPNALSGPRGITFDTSGNLYVANFSSGAISKLVLDSGTTYSCTNLTPTVGSSLLDGPRGITIDSNTGNLYVANGIISTVSKIVLSGMNEGTVSTYINSGLSDPTFIAFNPDKFLYISNFVNNSIVKTQTASCFNHDTKILCLNKEFQEEYLPIQDLRKGDIVKTYLHGYRKIDLIGKGAISNKPHIWNESMYKMVKTDTNGLFEDLIVTGGHAILVDEVTEEQSNAYEPLGIKGYTEKIDDKFLLMPAVSDAFVQLTDDEIYRYYHLVPENNGDDNQRFGIWANGILSETPSKNQFWGHKYEEM